MCICVRMTTVPPRMECVCNRSACGAGTNACAWRPQSLAACGCRLRRARVLSTHCITLRRPRIMNATCRMRGGAHLTAVVASVSPTTPASFHRADFSSCQYGSASCTGRQQREKEDVGVRKYTGVCEMANGAALGTVAVPVAVRNASTAAAR